MVKPEHEIEETLASYLHLRVVKTLASSPQPLTKYMLAKICGTSQRTTERILLQLLKHDWVVQTPYKPSKYSLNHQNLSLKKLIDFFITAGYLSKSHE